jgi:Tol biopolymer transport system component
MVALLVGYAVLVILVVSWVYVTNVPIATLAPQPSFIPNGNGKIIFALERGHIATINANGSNLRQHTIMGYDPSMSPDGKRIAFVRDCTEAGIPEASASASGTSPDPDTAPCIAVMDTDGSDLKTLEESPSVHPLWSPDGEKIALILSNYAEVYTLDYCDISVVPADGSGSYTTLPTPPNACVYISTWSPDGKKIAGELDDQIYVIKVSGRGEDKNQPMKLTKGYEPSNHPDWSPNGTEIAFVRSFEIHKMNTDGSGVTHLTHDSDRNLSPTWSPDGKQLAYVKRYFAGRSAIYIMNSDGSNPTLVRKFETNDVHLLDWQ